MSHKFGLFDPYLCDVINECSPSRCSKQTLVCQRYLMRQYLKIHFCRFCFGICEREIRELLMPSPLLRYRFPKCIQNDVTFRYQSLQHTLNWSDSFLFDLKAANVPCRRFSKKYHTSTAIQHWKPSKGFNLKPLALESSNQQFYFISNVMLEPQLGVLVCD